MYENIRVPPLGVTHVLRLTHIEILWRMEGSTFIGGFKYFRQDRIKFHLEWFKMMKVITLVSCAGFEEFLVLISFTWAVNITEY